LVPSEVVVLCLTIFFARICDVTFGTIRTVLIVDGRKVLAALCGFVEVCIWFAVVREALNSDVGGIYVVVSYAGGFAAGNLLGSYLSTKFLGEKLAVYIVTTNRDEFLVEALRDAKFAVTKMDCTGREDSERHFLFAEIKGSRLEELKKICKNIDSGAFITVHKTKVVVNGFLK